MAGSQEDSIRDLLKAYIHDEADLRDVVQIVLKERISIDTLIEMSDSDLDGLIREYFPGASSAGAKLGFKVAIRRKRKHPHDLGSHVYAEEAQPSQTAKWSREELALEVLTELAAAKERYFGKLLEPPRTLPRSDELWAFLALRPVPLPIRNPEIFQGVRDPELVVLDSSSAVNVLASFCDNILGQVKRHPPGNEATSSHELANLIGELLSLLNDEARANEKLQGLDWVLDSSNPQTSSVASKPLKPLLRPDFQLRVKDCLVLRWENKTDRELRHEAFVENTSKLRAWSPLFYGNLPYVIGGGCGGRQFQWLRLYPHGNEIKFEMISQRYDLNVSSDVVKLLHSTIRMHCLLQKLQEELDNAIPVALYQPRIRPDGGVVTIYPDFVSKEIPLSGKESTTIKSLYSSIAGSRYLIQLLSVRETKASIKLHLQPVGDPFAKPKDWKELENAMHDILRGIADLHKEGYTHRDLRWENVIKVNEQGECKWVIIDLEAAGRDNEKWVGEGLTSWDQETLEEDSDKRQTETIKSRNRYTKGSDMYQFGKLIAEWLDDFPVGGKEERQVMRSRARQMQEERTAATKMIEDVCKKRCERCRLFGTKP